MFRYPEATAMELCRSLSSQDNSPAAASGFRNGCSEEEKRRVCRPPALARGGAGSEFRSNVSWWALQTQALRQAQESQDAYATAEGGMVLKNG
jgi:hypothetical protein